tara:strand:- start:24 stop:362 length:339 start_codon:yes stop_codon:yes gene_type:complete
MNHYKISVEEVNNCIEVKVKMEEYDPLLRSKMIFETRQVVKYLKENNYKFGDCIQSASLYNRDRNNLEGTWVFEKISIKPLDKPAENVILPIEEKRPAPKKRQSRAKKTTNK